MFRWRRYEFETGLLGNIATVGLAIAGGVGGLDLAKDLTEYLSLNSDYINNTIETLAAVGGFGISGAAGLILGSYLPGGSRKIKDEKRMRLTIRGKGTEPYVELTIY